MTNARLVKASILLFAIGALVGFRCADWMFLFLLDFYRSQHLQVDSAITDAVLFQFRTALLLGVYFASPAIALLICPPRVRRARLALLFVGLLALLTALGVVAFRNDTRSMESFFGPRGVRVVSQKRAAWFGPILVPGSLLIVGIGAMLRLRDRPL